MRYRETGELHRDFHGALNTTVEYIAKRHGRSALREIFFNVGQKVHRSIHEGLKRGDASELIGHWNYFFTREGGDFKISSDENKVVMEVRKCPAVAHLLKLGLKPSKFFCCQTIDVNEAMCEGTPWKAKTEILGCGKCRQTISRTVKKGAGA
jgi:hypothetical protein